MRPEPEGAWHDVLVYKYLVVNHPLLLSDEEEYRTPARDVEIVFDADVDLGIKKDENLGMVVNEGYHAFILPFEEDVICRDVFGKRVKMFYAVIPKGTKYVFGKDSDVVAEKMLIYHDKELLKKRHPNLYIFAKFKDKESI
jgi:hypothetical protein